MSMPSYVPATITQTHKPLTLYKREKAWDIWPYPCIGGFRFMNLNLCTTAQYAEILTRVKNGEKLLDLGCCFGQELRSLLLDGAPSENLYGTDLRPEFFELGYDLFLDRETCKATFIAADIFVPNAELDALNGKLSVIYAGAFFHLFDRPEQLHLAKRVATLLSSNPGSMVLGRQVGNVTAGRYEHATNEGGWMFRHNEQSWKEMWDEAGRETGTQWEASAELRANDRFQKSGHHAEGSRAMHFCVKRV
ncbi:hypothetical protein LTR85_003954 [Meristemomyces frigidus]|nr:hypothetical protein LTR85_003954 [Meristemomyces frigidus]